jgi:hypothetical protein
MRSIRLAVPFAMLILLLSGLPALAVAPANPVFERTWERTDRPVSTATTNRTWMWGPAAFAAVQMEPYLQSPGGMRVVQYFDKSRMELTNPQGDPESIWYVTNGLLVREMVLGVMQVGDNQFEPVEPGSANVAGDAGDAGGPTYTTIAMLLDEPPAQPGETVVSRVDRSGTVTTDPSLADYNVTAGDLVAETGHRVASVFREFMHASGTVYQDGQYMEDRLFPNPFYATGFPITEAYWAKVQVAGTPTDVLLQCFERRCLTYTPGNPPGWQVEAGNVGRHYYEWRYGEIATPTTGDIRVTDIYYDPPDPGDRSGEYVTIQSFDPYPVDLTGWKLADEGPASTYTFPAFILQPGASVRVYNCTGDDSATVLFTGRCTAWWNNTGDTAYLYDSGGLLVSEFGY